MPLLTPEASPRRGEEEEKEGEEDEGEKEERVEEELGHLSQREVGERITRTLVKLS